MTNENDQGTLTNEKNSTIESGKKRGRKTLAGLPKIKSMAAKMGIEIEKQERQAIRLLERASAMRSEWKLLTDEIARYEIEINTPPADAQLRFKNWADGKHEAKKHGPDSVEDPPKRISIEDALARAKEYAQNHPQLQAVPATTSDGEKSAAEENNNDATIGPEDKPGPLMRICDLATLLPIAPPLPMPADSKEISEHQNDSRRKPSALTEDCPAEIAPIGPDLNPGGTIIAAPARTDIVKRAGGGAKDKGRGHLPKETPRIPIAWENTGGPKKPDPAPITTILEEKPPEPNTTILSQTAWTKILLIGPHPNKTTEEIANQFRGKLAGCTLAFVDPTKTEERTDGMILLRGGQWVTADLAVIFGDLKFSAQSFTSMTALEPEIKSQRIIRRIQWVIQNQEKSKRPR